MLTRVLCAAACRIPNALDNDKTAYFLSEKDAIMNSPRTARYLRDHGVRPVEEGGNLRMLAGMAHGGFM